MIDDDIFENNRKSFYFRDSNNILTDPGGNSFYTYMFFDDIHNSIMPYGKSLKATLDIDDPQVQLKVKLLFLITRGEHRIYDDLIKIVSGFVRECATILIAREGKTHFEIVEAYPDKTREHRVELPDKYYELVNISGKVLGFGGSYFQLLPPSIQQKTGKSFIRLPKSNVWAVKIPPKLGGITRNRVMLKNLLFAGKRSLLMSEIVQSSKRYFGFRVDDYARDKQAQVLKATKHWGWHGRIIFSGEGLEYYQIHKQLEFAYALAVFREYIIDEMNLLLNRLGYHCFISVEVLQKSKDIFELIGKLRDKKITFKEAYDYLYYA